MEDFRPIPDSWQVVMLLWGDGNLIEKITIINSVKLSEIDVCMFYWLVVSTPLKNSQLGWLFPIYGKINNGNQTTNQFMCCFIYNFMNISFTVWRHAFAHIHSGFRSHFVQRLRGLSHWYCWDSPRCYNYPICSMVLAYLPHVGSLWRVNDHSY